MSETIADPVTAEAGWMEKTIHDIQLKAAVHKAIETLSERDQLILHARFFDNKTLAETSQTVVHLSKSGHLSREGARLNEQSALRRLRGVLLKSGALREGETASELVRRHMLKLR